MYQLLISPLIGSRCRFYPSCSYYMIEAIEKKGVIKGVCLGLVRLSKCHPWNEGGMDPVPGSECCSQDHESDNPLKNKTQDEKKEETK